MITYSGVFPPPVHHIRGRNCLSVLRLAGDDSCRHRVRTGWVSGRTGPLRDYECAKRPLGPCQPCAVSTRTGGRTRSKQHHDSLSIAPSPSKGWRARRDLRSPLRRAPTNHLGNSPDRPDPTEEVRHAIPNRLNALVPGVAHDVGLVDPAVLGFGDKPGPQRMRRIPRCVLETG